MWRVLLVVLALVSVGGASASDSPPGRWLPRIVGFAPDKPGDASVAVGRNGTAVAIWNTTGLTAATHEPGGGWDVASLLDLALGGQSVAVDGAGNAIVTAWHVEDPSVPMVVRVVAFTRAAGSPTWSGPVTVSDAEPLPYWSPALAMNSRGQAVTVWVGHDGTVEPGVLRAAVRGADGAWSPPEDIGVADSRPSVAIDAHGDAVAVWADFLYGPAHVYAEFRPAGGDWGPPVVLSDRAVGWLDAG